MTLGLFVTVPLTVVGLMVIGMGLGIEYGRLGPAVLKIAAITCVATGIMYLGAWLKLPGMIVFPVSCFVTFGLFMTQFDLDTWETNVSVGALNAMSFGAKVALVMFFLAATPKGDQAKDSDGPVPSDTRPGGDDDGDG